MVYQLNGIISDVRVCLEENSAIESDDLGLAGIGDEGTLTLNEVIRSKVVEGVRIVHCTAPTHMLENSVPMKVGGSVIDGDAKSFGDSIYWEGSSDHGYVMLPEDFMRLLMFRMDDWERTVYVAKTVYEKSYERQSSRHKGLRGTPQKPVCVIGLRPEGRVLEFYGSESNEAVVESATYLPYPYIDEDDGIRISKRCYESAIYMISSLVAMTYGDTEKSAVLKENSVKLISNS